MHVLIKKARKMNPGLLNISPAKILIYCYFLPYFTS